MLLEQERRDVCLIARSVAACAAAAPGEAGTVSVRSGELVVITPAWVPFDQLHPADCPVMCLDDRVLEGRRDPAAEATLHMAVHRQTVQRSEEHTSELQSRGQLVCRLLLEK